MEYLPYPRVTSLSRAFCGKITAVSSGEVSVTLGVAHGPYLKTLPLALVRAGMLRRVLKSYPCFEIQDPAPDGSLAVIKRFPIHTYASRTVWGILRRLPKQLSPEWPGTATGWLTDQFWSRWVPLCTVFHNMRGSHLASLQAAKRQGAITLLENAGRHVRHWNEAHVEESARIGQNHLDSSVPWSARTVRHVEQEYALCDFIAVPSALAYRSLAEFGLGQKTVVVAPGVDTEFFSPPPRRERSAFRVCFVASMDLAKGVGYLLQAWKRLALPNAELVLVGAPRPETNAMLRAHADSTVRVTGYLASQELAQIYRESDLFVLPSVNEGLAQVLLEAMASGLPIVASDYSGADELITDGKEGFIVPARNVDALADAILWCYRHRDEIQAMGKAARARIESQFTLDHYNQRQIALYRKLAGRDAGQAA